MSERDRNRASKGGKARAAKLSPERRREIGIAGSLARWGKTLTEARYGSPDGPVRLGSLEIPCYILDDGRRMLVQKGVASALGVSASGGGRAIGTRLSRFAQGAGPEAQEVRDALENPILFRAEGATIYGYEAGLLPRVCRLVQLAGASGALGSRGEGVADRCREIERRMSAAGIETLVDDATGIDAERERDRVARELSPYVQNELKSWVGMFPAPFYEGLYRLSGLPYPPGTGDLPALLGSRMDDVVYERLGPGGKDELAGLPYSAADPVGDPPAERPASPRLREHLASVIALMRISRGYAEFEGHLDTALPRWNRDVDPTDEVEGGGASSESVSTEPIDP